MRISSLWWLPSFLSSALAYDLSVSTFDEPPSSLIYFEDSSVILYSAENGNTYRSIDDGASWRDMNVPDDAEIRQILEHPFSSERAYAISRTGLDHFYTTDRGETWTRFTIPVIPFMIEEIPISFHATNPDYLLFGGYSCPKNDIYSPECKPMYYYTTDGFKSDTKKLSENAYSCKFAQSQKEFKQPRSDKSILCSMSSQQSNSISDRQLAISSDFFKTVDYVSLDGEALKGIVGFGSASDFIVSVVAVNDNHQTGDEVNLVVSKDLRTWTKAKFSDESAIRESSFTILESSNSSLHVDVLVDPKDRFKGTFYTSNSEGTYFTKSLENTHRSEMGYVDIEKVQGIDGILIANVVVGKGKVRTKMSYDDGRTWNYIGTADCAGDDKCGLNFHSILDHHNSGRIFSSPAPGIIAGIGNTGAALRDYEDGNFYVSNDSGLTWTLSRQEGHIYEFGDQGNILLAAYDEGATTKAYYSLDRGVKWNELELSKSIRPKYLITTPDSTSMKFLLLGKSNEDRSKYLSMAINFDDLYEKKCVLKEDGSGDFEKWYARYDSNNGQPSCLMGRKQFFWRKKVDAKCLVQDLYHEQFAKSEPCECTLQDYECDTTKFILQGGECVPNDEYARELFAECGGDSSKKYTRQSGYKLVPGNECIVGKIDYAESVEKVCGSEQATSVSRNITATKTTFSNSYFKEYYYLKVDMSSDDSDETIILRDSDDDVYITFNQGQDWAPLLPGTDEFLGIYLHPQLPKLVYLITASTIVYRSTDRAKNFEKITLPAPLNTQGAPLFKFHHENPDWIIYHGEEGCYDPFSDDCKVNAYYSMNGGHSWHKLQDDVKQCGFVGGLTKTTDEKMVLCDKVQYDSGNQRKIKLISSTDFFDSQSTEHFDNIMGYALENTYIIVAAIVEKDNAKSLKAYVSLDGKTFAAADFPHNFHVDHQQAYTILNSVTNAVFMHVTVNNRPGSEYGTLLKSNSNGTEYVVSLEYVNRNGEGYVDFEKMQGLEGVAIVNTVENHEQATSGSRKKLKTQITHNDGAEWSYITPPTVDSEGHKIDCSGQSLEKCSLNLHGFTERIDYRDTFSSQSAVGMMIGVGNVGESLTAYNDGNTYLTRDGGVHWAEIRKGAYMWEFGDSGSILVIVNGQDYTNVVYYSLDEGQTWTEYKFSEEMVWIDDIATIPSDTSRKFLLLGRPPTRQGQQSFTISLDFTGLSDRKCVYDSGDAENDDFELWSPTHPLSSDDCLFGHVALYHRKKPTSDCYVGRDITRPHEIIRNCSCTRQDFECDFNYYRVNDGTCQLVPGYQPPDHSLYCEEFPGAVEYWEPTGYRRIPLSTCDGGREYDKIESHPCPGKEGEYEERHGGLRGFGLFLVIFLSIGMAAVICYVVYDHYTKRYGQIRLGEEEEDQPVVLRYAIIAVAGVIAVVVVIPSVIQTAGKHIMSFIQKWTGGNGIRRYTTRSSFRGQRYSPVDAEDELLRGEDLDEDENDLDLDIDAHMSDDE